MKGQVKSMLEGRIQIVPESGGTVFDMVYNFPYTTNGGKYMPDGAVPMMKDIHVDDVVEFAYGRGMIPDAGVGREIFFLKYIKKVDSQAPPVGQQSAPFVSGNAMRQGNPPAQDSDARQQLILLQHWENVVGDMVSRHPEMFGIQDDAGLGETGERFVQTVRYYSLLGYSADCAAFGLKRIAKTE